MLMSEVSALVGKPTADLSWAEQPAWYRESVLPAIRPEHRALGAEGLEGAARYARGVLAARGDLDRAQRDLLLSAHFVADYTQRARFCWVADLLWRVTCGTIPAQDARAFLALGTDHIPGG